LVLHWTPRRERIVRVISESGAMSERDLFFRTNIYVRETGKSWPGNPINATPLEKGQWIVTPGKTFPAYPPTAQLEFTLRLVDQNGNEGPLAEPLIISAARFYP